MKGLEGFHKRVKMVVQGMCRPLIQAPLHICTAHIMKHPLLTDTSICSDLPQAMAYGVSAPCNAPSPLMR